MDLCTLVNVSGKEFFASDMAIVASVALALPLYLKASDYAADERILNAFMRKEDATKAILSLSTWDGAKLYLITRIYMLLWSILVCGIIIGVIGFQLEWSAETFALWWLTISCLLAFVPTRARRLIQFVSWKTFEIRTRVVLFLLKGIESIVFFIGLGLLGLAFWGSRFASGC